MTDNKYGIELDTLEEAIADLQQGKPVILMDSPGREGEGDFICSAEKISPEWMKVILDEARGAFIAIFMPESQANNFDLPEQIDRSKNLESSRTNFRLTVDTVFGHSGCSAAERAQTANILGGILRPYKTEENNRPFNYGGQMPSERASVSDDLVRPGHVVPIVGHPEGLSKRQGHTETGIELMKLAKIDPPVAVDMEVLDPDDSYKMGSPQYLRSLADKHNLKLISIGLVCEALGVDELSY